MIVRNKSCLLKQTDGIIEWSGTATLYFKVGKFGQHAILYLNSDELNELNEVS